MIIAELCKDLIKTKDILKGLINFNTVSSTDNQATFKNEKKQLYRKMFQEYIVKGLKVRYSNQANLFYS